MGLSRRKLGAQLVPGLKVADVLMWHRATHARVVGHEANGVTDLAAFGLEPVPAWFRVSVDLRVASSKRR